MDTGGDAPRSGGGRPWWFWMAGGCGGCLVVLVVALIFAGVWLKRAFESADVGPVTPQSVKQAMGDVPLYPNSKLEPTGTEMVLRGFRVWERLSRKGKGSIGSAVASLETPDAPEKVVAFYDRKLPAAGWTRQPQRRGPRSEGRLYRKGREVVYVQASPLGGGRRGGTIILMRGGPGLAAYAPSIRATPEAHGQ